MIGVDISDRSIKVVEVHDDELPTLSTVCWSPLPMGYMDQGVITNVAKTAGVLQDALVKCSPRPVGTTSMVVASIPESQSFVRVVDVPKMSDTEMDEAVRWLIKEHIPFDLGAMHVDWEPLPSDTGQSNTRRVLVGAAQREVVDPLLQVLDKLGLTVVALELESHAVVRCLLPRSAEDLVGVRGVLVVDIGATFTDVALFDQGAIRSTSNLSWGGDMLTQLLVDKLNIVEEEANELKATVGASHEAANQQVAEIVRVGAMELVYKVEGVVSQLSGEDQVRTILLSGGSANLSGLTDLFLSVFPNIPVQLGNPLTNIAPADQGGLALSRTDAMHFTTAIGLGLREPEVY